MGACPRHSTWLQGPEREPQRATEWWAKRGSKFLEFDSRFFWWGVDFATFWRDLTGVGLFKRGFDRFLEGSFRDLVGF